MRLAGPLTLLALAAAGCGGGDPGRLAEPAGMRSVVLDHVQPNRDGTETWSSEWRLCWRGQPGASYEIEPRTSEGAGRIRSIRGRCISIEVAAGRHPAAAVPARRAAQLAATRSALAYRIRAVRHGRRGPWSRAVEAAASAA